MTVDPGSDVVDVAVVVVVRRVDAGWTVLVTKRPTNGYYGGWWEFPGGKMEPSESPTQAGRRELLEETGVRVGVMEQILVHEHVYPDRHVRLHVLVSEASDAMVVRHLEVEDHRWVAPEALGTIDLLAANTPIAEAVVKHLLTRPHHRMDVK
ncbi:MAG: (deoxy)nucleoside triphosphate pyrophosphohydrolase [Planctomycetota bacterium]